MLDFVALVTRHAYRTTDADVKGLRALGWTDPQVAECVYVTALFAFFNRVADAFGLDDPNDFENPPSSISPTTDPRMTGEVEDVPKTEEA